MFTFVTADQHQVRRCRMAQFSGRPATIAHDGADLTGLVHAIREVATSEPRRWSIVLIPVIPKRTPRRRPPKVRRP